MLKAMVWALGLMTGDPETTIGTTARLVEGTAAESAAAEMQAGIGTPQVLYMHLQTKPDWMYWKLTLGWLHTEIHTVGTCGCGCF